MADVSSAVLEYYNSSYGVPAGRPTFTCDVPESIAGNEGSYGVSLYATFAAQRGVVVDGQYSSVSLIGPAPRSALQPSYQADTLELQVLPSGDSTLSSTYPLFLLSPASISTCVSLSLSLMHTHTNPSLAQMLAFARPALLSTIALHYRVPRVASILRVSPVGTAHFAIRIQPWQHLRSSFRLV